MTEQQQPQHKSDELTSAEVFQIVEEIQAFCATLPDSDSYELYCFSHLRDMPVDAYEVFYEGGWSQVFFRHENGKLEPAETLAYFVPQKEEE
jgi:hypothetical protein